MDRGCNLLDEDAEMLGKQAQPKVCKKVQSGRWLNKFSKGDLSPRTDIGNRSMVKTTRKAASIQQVEGTRD